MNNMKRDDCPAFKRLGVHGKTVAFDLDGTLFHGCGSPGIGPLISGADYKLQRMKRLGYYIIIHTARINDACEEAWGPQSEVIRQALDAANVPHDEIWAGRGKPIACAYVDDSSWQSVEDFWREVEYREAVI